MFDNEFDELLRSRLKDHPSVVPEDMWQRICGHADSRRVWAHWGWYFVGVLVAGFVGGLFYISRPAGHRNPGGTTGTGADLAAASHRPAAHQMPTTQTQSGDLKRSSQTPGASKPAYPLQQTNSVPDPALTRSSRSGSVPRSQNGPGFSFTTTEPRGGAATPFAAGRTVVHWLPSVALISRTFAAPRAKRLEGNPLACPDPENIKKNSGWFVEAYFSPDYLFTSNRQGFSYSAGVRFGTTFKDRFSVMTGLQFSHVSLGGNLDSALSQQFNNIDIPLLLGYRLGSSDVTTYFHMGLIWNLHSQAVITDYGIRYRNNTGLAFFSGVDFLKRLSNHWSVFAEPHVRYQLTNRTANLLQSPDLGGVLLGVRYNFTRRAGVR